MTSHELSVWFKCDSGTGFSTSMTCGEGNSIGIAMDNLWDASMGRGCSVSSRAVPYAKFEANSDGTNDSGTAYVRVRKMPGMLPRGDSYNLEISVK